MAVREPLYEVSGNLREMSTAMVDSIVDQVIYQYSLNPSVALSVVSSGGNLGTITDTRKQAGAYSTSTTAFPSEATTAEPSTVTVSYSKINQTATTVSPTADTGKTWPVYYNTLSGNLQAMSLQDVKDTFLHPAIDLLTAATTTTQQAGTYFISSSSSVAGATEVSGSATPIFSDTRADTSLYTAGGIPETLDQPITITNYYLHRVNGSAPSFTLPYYVNASNNIQQFTSATFDSLLQEWIRYTAASSADGYAISYNLGTSGSGFTRGSGMGDTILVGGAGDYQFFQVGDDYRAQEFPDGTTETPTTYYLRINKS